MSDISNDMGRSQSSTRVESSRLLPLLAHHPIGCDLVRTDVLRHAECWRYRDKLLKKME